MWRPWCTDQGCGRNDPYPVLGSCDAGGLRASELQHAVEDVDTDIDLGHATPLRMQAANRSATRRRFSTSRSASTPPLDDNSPPSNLATTDLPDTGDRPGSGCIGSFMAGVASRKRRGLSSTNKS